MEIKKSKPIEALKKGDKMIVNGVPLVVEDQILIMEHKKDTKEMALVLISEKTKKRYQLRYFPHNLEGSLELYELDKGFIYIRIDKDITSVEW